LKILITGGAGFIGSHTTDALINAGHDVRILDSLQKTVHPKGPPAYMHPKAEFMRGDVRDKPTMEKALTGIDAVYHLAAYQDYLPDFSTYFHVNDVSTALLYEIIVERKLQSRIRKVIVAASQAVMGEGRYHCPACGSGNAATFIYPAIRLEEQLSRGEWEHKCTNCGADLEWQPSDETVINPCNQYAISKYTQEQIAIQLGRRYEIPSVAMRYSIVQGPRQSFYNAYSGAMRIFALSLFFKHAPTIFEDGQQVRDFVNIQDVVDANLLVLEKPEADYRVFNVGGGKAWTVLEFYEAMQQQVGRSVAPVMGGFYRYGDTRHILSDILQLRTLGWEPTRGVSDSIAGYWHYLNQQDEVDDILGYARNHMKNLQVIRKAT
jgi:dTDP-L-rhamnose 4-epimerase